MLATFPLAAQTDTIFKIQKTYPGEVLDFSIDNLGNIFILYQNGQLKKLNPNGDSLAVFNDVRRYGKLFSIDVTNPLKNRTGKVAYSDQLYIVASVPNQKVI